VPDRADLDGVLALIDLVQNPIGAAPGRMKSLVRSVQRFADPPRIGGQRAGD